MKKNFPYLQVAMMVALLIAVFCRMPYGYYTLLKVLCCAGFGYLAYKAHGKKLDAWMWTFGVVAILYNPFVKIHLGHEIWSIVNIVTAIILAIQVAKEKRR